MPVAKEQIRQIIADNNLNSVADVYTLLRDGFKDILQELMEAELDATLGYEKNQKEDMYTANKRNGHSPKKLKSQYGEFQIDVPGQERRVRAEDRPQVPAGRLRYSGKGHLALRQGDEHQGHPLQGQGGWPDPEPGGLCGAGRHDGRPQRDTQHHGRGQRELQVLDGDAERPEEPRRAGCAILLRGRLAKLLGGDWRRVPTGPDPAMRHPYAAQLFQICELQRPEEVPVRLQGSVQCPER